MPEFKEVPGYPGWKVTQGYLAAGGDFEGGEMTVAEALASCKSSGAPGFTYNRKEMFPKPNEKINMYIKGKKLTIGHSGDWVTYVGPNYFCANPPKPQHKAKANFQLQGDMHGADRTGIAVLKQHTPFAFTKHGNGYETDPAPKIISECKAHKCKFVDPEFPPVAKSLGPGVSGDDFCWVRAPELAVSKCNASLRSKVKLKLTIRNTSKSAVQLIWVSFDGEEVGYGSVAAGGSKNMTTYATHIWRFRKGSAKGPLCCPDFVVNEGDVMPEEIGRVKRAMSIPAKYVVPRECKGRGANQGCALFDPKKGVPCVHDCVQGAVGNCWLHQAITSCVDDLPARITKMFHPPHSAGASSTGCYSVRFWCDRQKKHFWVVVDDYLPVRKGAKEPYFAKIRGNLAESKGALWVAVLEKAYAKLSGGFTNLEAGKSVVDLCQAQSMMAGGGRGIIQWDPRQMKNDNGKIWKQAMALRSSGKVMSLSSSKYDNEKKGMVKFHGYALLDMCEVKPAKGPLLQLLKLRNTWGRHEWNGAWSDKSSEWDKHPDLKKKLQWEDRDDGLFWMAYKDFVQQFCIIWHN